MINEEQALAIINKYSPTTKLTIRNRKGREGIYITKTNEIIITKDWSMAGLLHELTHAILYLEQGIVGHDGVFADRFTKLVSEVFEEYV